MAYTATILAWGLIEFEDSYDGSGDLNKTRELIKWFSDYFVKSHTSKFELYVQVRQWRLKTYLLYLSFVIWKRVLPLKLKYIC